MDKKTCRQEIKRILESFPEKQLISESITACQKLCAIAEFKQARSVMLFLSMPGEVDTSTAIEIAFALNKNVLVPRIDWEQWQLYPWTMPDPDSPMDPDRYNLRYPADGEKFPVEEIDFVAVPGLGFDARGHRLGRGGGFYDRFLSNPQLRAFTCGIGLSEQVLPEIPFESHDILIKMLITDKHLLRFESSCGRL